MQPNQIFHFFAIFCYMACTSSFTWAILKFFKVENTGAHKGKRIVSLVGGLSSVSMLCFLILAESEEPYRPLIGVFFFSASLTLFWSAILTARQRRLDFAFSTKMPDSILNRGPYKLFRHPIYFAYMLCWVGGSVASSSIFASLIPVTMYAIYSRAARYEEDQFLSSSFSDEYKIYKQSTKSFFL